MPSRSQAPLCAAPSAEVGFDRIETFGYPHGSREPRALDAEAGLSGNPARMLELVADKAVSIGWEGLNGRQGAASFREGLRLALRAILLLSSGGGRAG
jgi:hypothetical protein